MYFLRCFYPANSRVCVIDNLLKPICPPPPMGDEIGDILQILLPPPSKTRNSLEVRVSSEKVFISGPSLKRYFDYYVETAREMSDALDLQEHPSPDVNSKLVGYQRRILHMLGALTRAYELYPKHLEFTFTSFGFLPWLHGAEELGKTPWNTSSDFERWRKHYLKIAQFATQPL